MLSAYIRVPIRRIFVKIPDVSITYHNEKKEIESIWVGLHQFKLNNGIPIYQGRAE